MNSSLTKLNIILEYIKIEASRKPQDSNILININEFEKDIIHSTEIFDILVKLKTDYNFIKDLQYSDGYFIFKVTKEFGIKFDEEINLNSQINYIQTAYITELKSIDTRLDLKMLIYILESMNREFTRDHYLELLFLERTLLDHVPPIFNKKNFDEVIDNVSRPISDKKRLARLRDSLKHSADKFLHKQIDTKSSLPDKIDVDYKQEIDLLLKEILTILKK